MGTEPVRLCLVLVCWDGLAILSQRSSFGGGGGGGLSSLCGGLECSVWGGGG